MTSETTKKLGSLGQVVHPKSKLINLYAFFTAFPVLLIGGQNLSILIFFLLVRRYISAFYVSSNSSRMLLWPGLFALSAIISVFSTVRFLENDYFFNALKVLPNFLYWVFIVIFFVKIRKFIALEIISKYIYMAIVLYFIYYNVQGALSGLRFIFNYVSPNTFSFVLICFSAPSFIYLARVKNQKLLAFIFLLIIVLFLIIEGRRAGTFLVLVPCILAFQFTKIKVKSLFLGLLLFTIGFASLQLELVERSIEQLNPRIYALLYESESISIDDRSFLTRKLQTEKALIILNENPLTGIGLNNFMYHEVSFLGDFEGSELVINKIDMNEKSAHNSYMALLAEGGLFLFIPYLLILITNLRHFVLKYNIRSPLENAFYWSFIGMSIHLYFISGLVNVYVWFLIAMVTMLSVKYSDKELLKMRLIKKT